jgi:hypothetical protein
MLVLIGCGGDAVGRGQAFMTRDSAGVEVIEYDGESGRPPNVWQSELDLTIGVVDGAEHYQFHRILGATQLGDGTIVVLNNGTSDVRYYDSRGTFLGSVGQEGDGPEEFRFPFKLLRLASDSIAVFDAGARRFTIISPHRVITRTVASPHVLSGLVALLGYHRALLAEPADARGLVEIVANTPTVVRLVDLRGGEVDTVGIFGSRKDYISAVGERVLREPVPFTVHAQLAVHDDRIYLTDGLRPEVHVLDADGKLIRVMRVLEPLVPLERRDLSEYVSQRIEREPDAARRRDLARIFPQITTPSFKPVYADLKVSDAGEIWLLLFDLSGQEDRVWRVLSPQGRPVGTVRTPTSLRVADISGNYLLGIYRDEMGVEFVRRYRILRSEN